MELFKLLGTIAIDNDNANKAINDTTDKADSSESRISSAFKRIGAAVATFFAVDKIISFGKASVTAAADVAAEAAAFSQIMGDYSGEAQKKINEIADAAGITVSRLTPYMTSMTAKFKGLGFDVKESTDMAQTGLTIAADAAAFWDKSLDDSMGALNSFINGNYEGGEAIGLFANETTLASWASKNLGLEWKKLDEKDKQLARLKFAEAMQKASGAAGQAARESDSYANVQGNLTEAWRQFMAVVGKPILNNFVIPAMKKLVAILPKAAEKTKVVVKWIKDAYNWYKKNETVIKAVAIAVGVFVTALKTMKLINTVKSWVTKAKTAVILFNAALKANPIGIVVAAIMGLAAAFIYLWKRSEKFRNFWKGLWKAITDAASKAAKSVSNKFDEIKASVKKVQDNFNKIKNAMTDSMESAKKKVGSAIDKIKGFFPLKIGKIFSNLKIPKISVSGGKAPFGIAGKGKLPSFNVKWNAQGAILTKPTIFGANGGQLQGSGEDGHEAVLPIDNLKAYVKEAVTEKNDELIESFETQISRLISFMRGFFPADYKIMLDTGILAGQLAPEMDGRLADIYRNNLRGNTR